jgi:methylated-DNA-[protein]-cysteine S-methyltransferase
LCLATGDQIITSNLYIGGFSGEWGTGTIARGGQNTGLQCNKKIEMLAKEGVTFFVDEYLADESLLWIGRGWTGLIEAVMYGDAQRIV